MKTNIRIQLSLMMFLQFFVWGAWLVTMWQYLVKINFTAPQIGNAYSTTGWAAMISPLFVGMIADRFFSAQKVLGVIHLLGAAIIYYSTKIVDPGTFFWVMLAYCLCYMSTLPIVNAIAFGQMSDIPKQFGSIRVWGTIGWIASGLFISYTAQPLFNMPSIEATNIPFKIAAAASVVMAIFSFTLPSTPPNPNAGKVTISDVLGFKAIQLLKEPSFCVFTICSFLICIPLAFYYQSAAGFVSAIGIDNPAAKMTMGQCSEIVFMLVMPFFLTRLGIKKMLCIGMLFWFGRYALFAYGASQPLMIYIGIICHGICYDFFFVTGQIYVEQKADDDIRSSAQGFITLVTLGCGMVIGNLINGKVTGNYTSASGVIDWKMIWLIPAAMSLIVAICFAISFKERPNLNKRV